MNSDDNLIDVLRTELRAGFGQLSNRIDLTNEQLANHTKLLEHHTTVLENHTTVLEHHTVVLEGQSDKIDRLTDTIGETKRDLDLFLVRFEDFQIEVSKRFDGVGAYLRSINGTLEKHGQNLDDLNRRVDKLEDKPETT